MLCLCCDQVEIEVVGDAVVEAADDEESTTASGPDVDTRYVEESQDTDCAPLPSSHDQAIVSVAAGEAPTDTM